MLNKKSIIYLAFIYILNAYCFYLAYNISNFNNIDFIGIIIFSILAVITESLLVTFKKTAISSSFAIIFAASLLFNPFFAMFIVAIGVTFKIVKKDGKYFHLFNIPIYKTLFNIANLSISTFLISITINFYKNFYNNSLLLNSIQFLSVICIFIITNALILSILISLLTNDNFIQTFINLLKFGLLAIPMAPFGYLIAYLYTRYNLLGILLLMIPVLFARYTYILYVETKIKYMETIEVLMHALESRDKYTEGHSRNVARIVEMIARELKFSESKIEELKLAAYLHDVGKIGISDAILNKPGKLTEEEYNIIKHHPEIGYQIVKDIKDLGRIPEIIRYHHERYDGKGYPAGKKGEELGIDVFILQLADSIDAMMTDRVYRKALSQEEVMREIITNSGKQFHPKVVEAYLRACEKQKSCKERG